MDEGRDWSIGTKRVDTYLETCSSIDMFIIYEFLQNSGFGSSS